MTAGPTRESIDPVRVVTNRSSGKMGYRIAEAAWERGRRRACSSPGRSRSAPPVGVDGRGGSRAPRSWSRRCGASCPAADVLVMAAAPGRLPAQRAQREQARRGATARWRFRWSRRRTSCSATRDARRPGSIIVGLRAGDGRRAGQGPRRSWSGRTSTSSWSTTRWSRAPASRSTPTGWRSWGATARRRSCRSQSKREVAEAILDAVERHLG